MSKYHPAIQKILDNTDRFVSIPFSPSEDRDFALGKIVLSFWDDFNHCTIYTTKGCSVDITIEEEKALCEKFFESHLLRNSLTHQCIHLDNIDLGF